MRDRFPLGHKKTVKELDPHPPSRNDPEQQDREKTGETQADPHRDGSNGRLSDDARRGIVCGQIAGIGGESPAYNFTLTFLTVALSLAKEGVSRRDGGECLNTGRDAWLF